MKKYVWEIQDGTRVACQKDPGNQYEYYYAIGYDNICEDVIDDEETETTCNVKNKLVYKNNILCVKRIRTPIAHRFI